MMLVKILVVLLNKDLFLTQICKKKIWKIKITEKPHRNFYINGYPLTTAGERFNLAKNDGLTIEDLSNWFNKDGVYQIICWSEDVEY